MGYIAGSTNRCITCNIQISPVATRCVSCNMEYRHANGMYDHIYTDVDIVARRSEGAKRAYREGRMGTPEQISARASKASLGRKHSVETRMKMSDAQKARYENPEERIKTSESSKRVWEDSEFRVRHSTSMKRALADPELRQRLSDASKEAWARGDFDDVDLNNYGGPSKIELTVFDAFLEFGIDAISQYRPDDCRYVYDILLLEYQTLVEVDGEYWHYSEQAIARGVPEHDAEKDEWAINHDFDIVRIPEVVLMEQGVEATVKEVLHAL